MLHKYFCILKFIDVWVFCNGEYPSGNDIANNFTEWFSRASTYRYLSKMEKLGLVSGSWEGHKITWQETDKGLELKGKFNALPWN